MNIKMLLSGIAIAIASQSAMAGDMGFYAGIAGGSAKFKDDELSGNGTEFRLFGGKSLNQNLAIEGGYARLGNPSSKTINNEDGSTSLIEFKSVNTIFVDSVVKLPLNQYGVNGLTPFVKLGIGYNKANDNGGNATKLRYGAGAMYEIQKDLLVRLDYTHNFKEADYTNRSITAGVQYNY